MGQTRLGTLPDTAPWRRVVGLIAEDADTETVATATTQAAQRGIRVAIDDPGLIHCTWLLAQVVLAARQPDFGEALDRLNILVTAPPDLFDLVSGFSDAVDSHLCRTHDRTDIGETAQLAAIETLTALLGQRSANLFEAAATDIRGAAHQLSTRRGFGTLTHQFFSRFLQRFLTYHLGRELSNHVGGNGRFPEPAEHTQFLEQLAIHCSQAAAIMREFAGDWYSKADFEGGVTPAKARGFVNHALTELHGELKSRGERDGQ